MCLGVTGQLIEIQKNESEKDFSPPEWMRKGEVRFGGITKEVNLAYTPEAKIGDYVIVHVGFAISIVDEAEANRIFETLSQLGDL